jgi:hypothetical protein
MQVTVGDNITTSLIDPAGDFDRLGARVEVPITEAIVSPYQDATLTGGLWTVTLDPILEPGDYLLYWMTPDSPATFREPVPLTALSAQQQASTGELPDFPPVDPDQVTPTVQEVADIDRTRAIDDTGDEVENFGSTTRPTDTDVSRLITQAVGGVLGQLRFSFPPDYYDDVRHMVCLYTAILIEGSFFKEQVTNSSAVLTWRTMLEDGLKTLNESIDYELSQWRLMQRIEPPFTPVRDPWQMEGWIFN